MKFTTGAQTRNFCKSFPMRPKPEGRSLDAKLLQMSVLKATKNASNGTCRPRKMLPILLAMVVASFQYWRRRRRAGSKIASNGGTGPPKIASNGASQLPKLLPILLAMEVLGFYNGKHCFSVPSNFPCNGRAWLPKR